MIDFACLHLTDQYAVCAALALPLPTPAVPLTVIIQEKFTSPNDALARLERAKDWRTMVAVAALRGKVTKCPDDAQLHPQPYAKPAPAPARKKRVPIAADTAVLVSFIPNPKKPGSAAHDRYQLYKVGLTKSQLLDRGLWPEDLRWDLKRGHLTWSD